MALYLVTGAAGFIGSRVCELLLEAGHTIVGVDNLNDYYDIRLKQHRLRRLFGQVTEGESDVDRSLWTPGVKRTNRDGRFIFQFLDIENRDAVAELFREYRFDAVINLAARAGVRYSIEHPHVYMTTNVIGTLNLLETQRRAGVSKHILASSSSLYASCPMPFVETQPVNEPLSPYAASKKAAEMVAYSYHKIYGLDVGVLRFFTVFGPAGRPDMSPFRFIKWIDEGKPITLFGDGRQARDFTYVDDIAAGVILALKPPGFEIFNLGGGRTPMSLLEIIALIEQLVGRKAHLEIKPAHAADVKETSADITKAARVLDWRPTVSTEDGFRRTVDWHTANREWLRQISV